MIIIFIFSIFFYLLFFIIIFLIEFVLYFFDLLIKLVLSCMKEYFFDGIGVFFVIFFIIVLVLCMKKGYWFVLVFIEVYFIVGLFVGMLNVL